jgi:hypothetical protein
MFIFNHLRRKPGIYLFNALSFDAPEERFRRTFGGVPDGFLLASIQVHCAPRVGNNMQAAGLTPEEHPSGAKAHLYFLAFAARLKSCPVTKPSRISRACEFFAAY